MAETNGLTGWEVKELVYTWFRKLTIKVPEEEMLALLSAESLEMRFPEETLRNHTDFKQWYKKVTHLFFDQVHELKMLDVDIRGDQATVHLIVNWQARTWNPPAGFSEWRGFNVHQKWIVVQDPKSGKPVISVYHVGEFDPMQQS